MSDRKKIWKIPNDYMALIIHDYCRLVQFSDFGIFESGYISLPYLRRGEYDARGIIFNVPVNFN